MRGVPAEKHSANAEIFCDPFVGPVRVAADELVLGLLPSRQKAFELRGYVLLDFVNRYFGVNASRDSPQPFFRIAGPRNHRPVFWVYDVVCGLFDIPVS